MRKGLVTLLALATLVVGATSASAQVIVRDGADYDGYANPGGAVIKREGTELHVNAKYADAAARIRYRFLRDVGGKFRPADVSVKYEVHGGGAACKRSDIRWMVPVPRTVRFIVPAGCYLHVVSVRWVQH